jgi:hypothetical protein
MEITNGLQNLAKNLHENFDIGLDMNIPVKNISFGSTKILHPPLYDFHEECLQLQWIINIKYVMIQYVVIDIIIIHPNQNVA